MLKKECNKVTESARRNCHSVSWACFVPSIKLRKVKAAVKDWFPVFQENQNRKKDDLIRQIERWDALAERRKERFSLAERHKETFRLI